MEGVDKYGEEEIRRALILLCFFLRIVWNFLRCWRRKCGSRGESISLHLFFPLSSSEVSSMHSDSFLFAQKPFVSKKRIEFIHLEVDLRPILVVL